MDEDSRRPSWFAASYRDGDITGIRYCQLKGVVRMRVIVAGEAIESGPADTEDSRSIPSPGTF
jgi:hypothetical protein